MTDIAAFIEARLVEHENAFGAAAPETVGNWVGAMRRVLEAGRLYADAQYPDFEGGYSSACDDIIGYLAGIWKTHDEYREEWKVGP